MISHNIKSRYIADVDRRNIGRDCTHVGSIAAGQFIFSLTNVRRDGEKPTHTHEASPIRVIMYMDGRKEIFSINNYIISACEIYP